MSISINWINASSKQRAYFYPLVKLYLNERYITWPVFFDAVAEGTDARFNHLVDVGNFRKGTLDRKKVNLIWRWFLRNESELSLEFAKGFDPEFTNGKLQENSVLNFENLGQFLKPRTRWEAFILQYGKVGEVDIRIANDAESKIEKHPKTLLSVDSPPPPAFPMLRPDTEFSVERAKRMMEDFEEMSAAFTVRDLLARSSIMLEHKDAYALEFSSRRQGTLLMLVSDNDYHWWVFPLHSEQPYFKLCPDRIDFPFDKDNKSTPIIANFVSDRRHLLVIANETIITEFLENAGVMEYIDWENLENLALNLIVSDKNWEILRLDLNIAFSESKGIAALQKAVRAQDVVLNYF